MCGIVGAVDLLERRSFPRERLVAMARAVAHRGPDDEAFHIEPGLAMAVRRLALVDPEHGRQPLANARGDVWVCANGELFDHVEQREALEKKGHVFTTRCDTELWSHLYEDFGEGVFDQARGQFAVAIWDREKRTLLLGRDRIGICPLYYAERDGWLLWASEVKGLLASGLVEARPDRRGIDHLFSFFCAGTSRSFFEGISLITPGHFLRISGAQKTLRRYWDLDFPDAGSEFRTDEEKLAQELEAILRRAVERRVRADAPVVAYISGGLDSTMILGLACEAQGRPIPSFTIGLDQGAGPDERPLSSETARQLGSKLTTLTLNRADIAAAFPELVMAAEGPVIDTANACLLRLAEKVHEQGFKATLTGEGADEAFAGYFWYRSQKAMNALEQIVGESSMRRLRQTIFGLVGGPGSFAPYRALRGQRTAQQDMHDPLIKARGLLYSDEMWQALEGYSAHEDLDIDAARIRRWHPLNQSIYLEYKLMLPGHLLLGKGDRVAMHSSVETRYPYLDEEVISFAANLSPDLKLHGYQDKWLLRKVSERVLPSPISRRPKSMFKAVPVFCGTDVPTWVDQLLSPESLRKTGYFDADAVTRERNLQKILPTWSPRRFVVDGSFTGVVATQLWHHLYCGGGLCELPVWS